jgi:hypothetical protein|tara:strand:- start:2268 stop:2375 length:108 start_codon:yes stop_codon:yes gene_type:complete
MDKLKKDLIFLIEEFEDGHIDAYKLIKLIKEKIND